MFNIWSDKSIDEFRVILCHHSPHKRIKQEAVHVRVEPVYHQATYI